MVPKVLFGRYLERLAQVEERGDAREESFYPALKELIEEVAKVAFPSGKHRVAGQPKVQVTVQPRPTEVGNPDFRVWDGTSHIVGYIEAKAPGTDLDREESSEQLSRYRSTFPNLILTDFLEFRLYRDGERVAIARLERPLGDVQAVWTLLERFLGYSMPAPTTAEALAVELAKRTRHLKEVLLQRLGEEKEAGEGELLGLYEAFKEYLIRSLSEGEFADLYAQTVTYGLFAARSLSDGGFSRERAFLLIPPGLGLLRRLFQYLSRRDLPDEVAWAVDEIAYVLERADLPQILAGYRQGGKGDDPIVHFYETFLAQYDPEERERRGVYYTPDPVVSYIVRSLHILLKEKFGEGRGLAGKGVTLLDPAAGTMTFVVRAAEQAVEEFKASYGDGGLEELLREHILRNFYAFEVMMAPYAVGYLKMALFLEGLGYRLGKDDRVPFYLTNALDMSEYKDVKLADLSALAKEAQLAGEVKRDKRILVILGNPPYSVESANKGDWILQQIEEYKKVDGVPLKERNLKNLQDDYVKFIRFAQWKIERAGRGVVGMITNHSYLDNSTFRGMRYSLLKTFDEIYVLDLHGNSLKRERCPDGGPDENVFDIRQGVAIAFFVKHGKESGNGEKKVRWAELWGKREEKYAWLEGHDVKSTEWKEITPKPPLYLFVPQEEEGWGRYRGFPRVNEVFGVYGAGIITGRDRLTIHWTRDEMWGVVEDFSKMDPEKARRKYQLGKDTRDWKVALAQKDLKDSGPSEERVVPILYRPFDVRYTYYTGSYGGFHRDPRSEVMDHMLAGENVALVFARLAKASPQWNHCFVTTLIADYHVGEAVYLAPLYLYPIERKGVPPAFEERRPNIKKEVFNWLEKAYGEAPTPEEVFHYIYAVLYAPTYRERYASFLRFDFPRIPFPREWEVFREMAGLGERLVSLHLLRSPDLDPPSARFEGKGSRVVEKVRYEPETGRVYVNGDQYFAPVPQEVWAYTVGGYQVCHKWLKDRKGRRLSLDEITTYCQIVTALERTILLQGEIDRVYARVDASPLGEHRKEAPLGGWKEAK